MTVEKIAVNLMDARFPDNRNQQPLDQAIEVNEDDMVAVGGEIH